MLLLFVKLRDICIDQRKPTTQLTQIRCHETGASFCCPPDSAVLPEVSDGDGVAENVSIRTNRLSPVYQQSCVIDRVQLQLRHWARF